MVICPSCGATNRPDAAFCLNCAAWIQPSPCLVVPGSGAVLVLLEGKGEFSVGREDAVGNIFPDVDLTEHDAHAKGVSRRHARLFWQGRQWYVEDQGAENGTFVDGRRVTSGVPVPLQDGSRLRLGELVLSFHRQ
jgi:pSer/pThr/pTyr-binding forkhead associated (FHA) protein